MTTDARQALMQKTWETFDRRAATWQRDEGELGDITAGEIRIVNDAWLEISQGQASTWHRVEDEMPDSDTTVLGYNAEWNEPVWPCFHDGENWCDPQGSRFGHVYNPHPSPTHWTPFQEPPK